MIFSMFRAVDSAPPPEVLPPDRDSLLEEIIERIARDTFIELFVCTATVGLTCLFTASLTSALPVISYALFILTVNTSLRCLEGSLQYKFQENRSSLEIISLPAPLLYSSLDLHTRDAITHEVGHLVAASALYKNANPRMILFPFRGAKTGYNSSELSTLGKMVGFRKADLITTIAGPLSTLIISTGALIKAYQLPESHKKLKLYLLCCSIMSIFRTFTYAQSASVKGKDTSHDFTNLIRFGISPFAASVGVIALPVIALGIYISVSASSSSSQ